MTTSPALSVEQLAQIAKLHAQIGEITVEAEHINYSMGSCLSLVLTMAGLGGGYAEVVTAGFNIENMRRVWMSVMNFHYSSDENSQKIVNAISKRVDSINRRRNNMVHRLWFIGYGSGPSDSYEVATGIKTTQDPEGGVKHNVLDSKTFQEIIDELKVVKGLVDRVCACVSNNREMSKNFHFSKNKSGDDMIVGGPLP